jgi:acetyl-CoA acetyltransferase
MLVVAATRVSSPVRGPTNSVIRHWPHIVSWRRQAGASAAAPGKSKPTVTVIGGGAAGLTAAYFAAFKLNAGQKDKASSQKVNLKLLLPDG